jgi:hypothetical protein
MLVLAEGATFRVRRASRAGLYCGCGMLQIAFSVARPQNEYVGLIETPISSC